MTIELREVSLNKVGDCPWLISKLRKDGILTNRSKSENGWIIKAIYHMQTLIGVTVYGYSSEYQFYEIRDLIINEPYKEMGYEKLALAKVIEALQQMKDCKEIYSSVRIGDPIKTKFYQAFNFQVTDQMLNDKCLLVLTCPLFRFEDQFDVIAGKRVTLKIIEKHPGSKVLIPFYYYDIYENHHHQKVGKISIRIGHNDHSYYNGHIGYEIDTAYRGHHYSLDAARLVLEVARYHGMTFLYVTCKESNQASRKIIQSLGGELLEITEVPSSYFAWVEGMGPYCIFKVQL